MNPSEREHHPHSDRSNIRPEHPYKELWRNLAQHKINSASDHVIYALIKAILSKSEYLGDKIKVADFILRSSFAPVTNVTKLSNGRTSFDSLSRALVKVKTTVDSLQLRRSHTGFDRSLHSEMLDTLTDAQLNQVQLAIMSVETQLSPSEASTTVFKSPGYVYIIVRQDLSLEQQLVQAAHATMELGAWMGIDKTIEDPHFVVIGAADLDALGNFAEILARAGHDFVAFREPDIGESTAIATWPLYGKYRRIFKDHRPLRMTPRTVMRPSDDVIEHRRRMKHANKAEVVVESRETL